MLIPRLPVTCCVASLLSLPIQGQQPEAARIEPQVDVRVVTDEADAVFDLLAKRASSEALTEADWEHLESTEGYRRLKQRDESFGVEAFDSKFRDWLQAVDPADLGRLRDGVRCGPLERPLRRRGQRDRSVAAPVPVPDPGHAQRSGPVRHLVGRPGRQRRHGRRHRQLEAGRAHRRRGQTRRGNAGSCDRACRCWRRRSCRKSYICSVSVARPWI